VLFTGLPLSATPAPHVPEDDDILDLGADYSAVTRVGVLPPNPAPVAAMPPALPEPVAMQPVTMPAPELAPPPLPPEPVAALAKAEPVPTPWALPPLPEPAPTMAAPVLSFEPPPLPHAEPAAEVPAPPLVAALAEQPAMALEAIAEPAVAVSEPLAVESDDTTSALAEQEPVKSVAAEPARAEPAAAPGPRTLEDSVADLLRPMLRDWLDTNMPRIVEKMAREGR
jgi:hypothetical protein